MEHDKQSKLKRLMNEYKDTYLSAKLDIINSNKGDERIICSKLINSENFHNIPLKSLEDKLYSLGTKIEANSHKTTKLNAEITGNIREGKLIIISEHNMKRFYFTPLYFNYLSKPNTFFIKANYSLFNRHFNKRSDITRESELSSIAGFNFNKNKFFYSISDTFYLANNFELQALAKSSKMVYEVNRRQTNNSYKIVLSRNFNQRPFIFRENNKFDIVDKLNLQYSHKIIKNYIGENYSPEIYSKIPQQDSQHHFKICYLKNMSIFNEDQVSILKMSSSLIKTLNSTYLKNRLFYRQIFFSNPLLYQFNLEIGNVTNIKGENDQLKLHEKLYVFNFKGVENPSCKTKSKHIKLILDISPGLSTYMLISNKILFRNLPLFNILKYEKQGVQLMPQINFNLLLTPNLKSNIVDSLKDGVENHLRVSAGVGLSLVSDYFYAEINYNAYIKKNSGDVENKLSFSIGLD
jgi:hypothetical protein